MGKSVFLCGTEEPSDTFNMQRMAKSKEHSLNALTKRTTAVPAQPASLIHVPGWVPEDIETDS